jgi:hypothetical protein
MRLHLDRASYTHSHLFFKSSGRKIQGWSKGLIWQRGFLALIAIKRVFYPVQLLKMKWKSKWSN